MHKTACIIVQKIMCMQNTTNALKSGFALYAVSVSTGIHVSVFSSIVGGVPSVLCLRRLAVPDVCHATRHTRGFQVSPSTVPSHIRGQIADCLDCSAELLDYEGTG